MLVAAGAGVCPHQAESAPLAPPADASAGDGLHPAFEHALEDRDELVVEGGEEDEVERLLAEDEQVGDPV